MTNKSSTTNRRYDAVEFDRLLRLADRWGYLIIDLDGTVYEPTPRTRVAVVELASEEGHYRRANQMPLCLVEAWIRDRTE